MSQQILMAVEKLKNGEVVAIPTETVYGLAAVVSNIEAIKKIFTTKQRPFFDPLIVHVSNAKQAKNFTTEWIDSVELLTQEFWPGPLTLVLPKKNISDLITSGLPNVGLRCPAHKMALEIIDKVGEPVAAPSANRFGKTSPTKASHVIDEFNGEVFVVDGGPSSVGIESTIISINEQSDCIEISVLRSGTITRTQIENCLRILPKKINFILPRNKIIAPGQIAHHYMPNVPILWVNREVIRNAMGENALSEALSLIPNERFKSPRELVLNADPVIAARELYSQMRICSEFPTDIIIYVKEPFQKGELWDSIIDRLSRASTYKFL